MSMQESASASSLSGLGTLLEKSPEEGVRVLSGVPERLNELVRTDQLTACRGAIELLGNALAKQSEWQIPFKESGILDHVLKHLNAAKNPVGLTRQHLRVIGNCVADNDETREVAVDYLDEMIACLETGELQTTALAVMLNLCNEYDRAQVQAAKLRLDKTMIDYLTNEEIEEDALDYAVDLLTWATEKLDPSQLVDSTSIVILKKIVDLALDFEDEHYSDYVSICVHYLENPNFQQRPEVTELMGRLFDLVLDYESRLTPEEIQSVFQALSSKKEFDKIAVEDINVALVAQLVNALSAISASDAFRSRLAVDALVQWKGFGQKLCIKPLYPQSLPSTVLACVILGNLANSDEACTRMVESLHVDTSLHAILSQQEEPALLYAAAGFMRHLAFAPANRSKLGELGVVETCCRLLSNNDPSVRGEAAAILGKLVSENVPNIKRLVYGTIPPDVSLFHTPGIEVPERPTLLFYAISEALAPSAPLPSSSMKNAGIEVGRMEVALLRSLRQMGSKDEAGSILTDLFQILLFARPIVRLVRQRFYAEARSEGLFGLGLMVQSEQGAICVMAELEADQGLLEAVKELALPQKSGSGSQEATRDTRNAAAFLHSLTAHTGHLIDGDIKTNVDALRSELDSLLA